MPSLGTAVAVIPAFFSAALTSRPSGHEFVSAAIILSAVFCTLSTETFVESEPPQAASAVVITADTASAATPPGIFIRSRYPCPLHSCEGGWYYASHIIRD